MEYEFEENINKLRHQFQEKPKEVNQELKKVIHNLEKTKEDSDFNNIFKDIAWDILIICVLAIMIAAMGLFSKNIGLYLFGLAFFLAGLGIGMFAKVFGIIFLFSHGITGLCIMEGSMIGDLLSNPKFTDGTSMFYFYAGIVILIFAIATMITIIHNLSDTAKKIKWFKIIPMVLYFLGFLLTIVFVNII